MSTTTSLVLAENANRFHLIVLQQALDDTQDPTAIAMVVRNLKLQDDLQELEEARKTANLRSGSRGLAARKELKVIEKRVAKKQEE